MGDCSFVEVAEPIMVRQDGVMATRLGLLSYQDESGQCYYWTDSIPVNVTNPFVNGTFYQWGDQQLEYYVEQVLGRAWYPTIALGIAAVFTSFLTFLYVTSYCCSTQVRGIRMFTGFFVAIVIVICQGLLFLVLDSDWCRDNQCETSRSAGFAYAAIVAFFISGVSFFFMSNYPGQAALAKLQEEHHQHVMAGDEEAPYPVASPTAKFEDLEDEPSEEEPLPGDDNYVMNEGIEKSLTGQTEPEAAAEDTTDVKTVTAETVADPESAQNGAAAAVVTAEVIANPDYSTSLSAPKPPSEYGD